MKRLFLSIALLLAAFAGMAQPSFRQPQEGPSIEDFPQHVETDRSPVNATFSFAQFSDLHISDTLPNNIEDLQRAIDEVNARADLAFVLVSGDITHNGDTKSLRLAKQMLEELRIPYYVVPGNHDTRVSESAAMDFYRVFGDMRFRLFFNGYLFLGLNTGQLLRPADAHVQPQDVAWLSRHLRKTGRTTPVYLVTHHPLKGGDVDNWEAVTDVLRAYNTQAVLCGHYHRNAMLNFDGITGVVARSTLRGGDEVGGYTLFDVADSLYISEKRIGQPAVRWCALPTEARSYAANDEKMFPRPNFDVNKQYKSVKTVWRKTLDNGIYGSVALNGDTAFVGDDSGMIYCMDAKKGKRLWQYKTAGRIAAAPVFGRGKVMFGSGDGTIYCLNAADGKLLWKQPTGQAVCATPVLDGDVAYVGSGDGKMRAVNIESGALLWTFEQTQGFILSKAIVQDGKTIFFANDKRLYAVDNQLGTSLWTCELNANPTGELVAAGNAVFVATATNDLVAVDVATGQVRWRSTSAKYLSAMAASHDGTTLYVRTNDGQICAFDATINSNSLRWNKEGLYKKDKSTIPMSVRSNELVFATKNGLIICVDSGNGNVLWQHKIGNTGINQLVPIGERDWLLTTLDGIVERLTVK